MTTTFPALIARQVIDHLLPLAPGLIAALLKPGGVCLVHLRGAAHRNEQMLSTLLPVRGLQTLRLAELTDDSSGLFCVACR
jgi:hypothetical protein